MSLLHRERKVKGRALMIDVANYHKNLKKEMGVRKTILRDFKFLSNKFEGRRPSR